MTHIYRGPTKMMKLSLHLHGTRSFCPLAILPSCCFVNLSFCQFIILAIHHFASLSFCLLSFFLLVTSPTCRIAYLSHRLLVIHFVNLSFFQLVILPNFHYVNLLSCQPLERKNFINLSSVSQIR